MSDIPTGGPLLDLLGRVLHTLSRDVPARLARIDRGVMFKIWGGGTVVVFVGIVLLSLARGRDVFEMVGGVFVAAFSALLFAVAMGWLVVSVYGPRRDRVPARAAQPGVLEQALAPVLRELDGTRREISRAVRQRSFLRVPLGMAAAFLLWVVMQSGNKPPDAGDLIVWLFLGAVAGEIWAISKLDREYRRLFKRRVLPALAGQFGELTYREAGAHHLDLLRERGILPAFDRATAEDEIAGTYHGMAVSIVEARLVQGSGKKRRVVFDGLLIDVTLPRALTGTTAITPDGGMLGNFAARWRADALERVRLEHPQFEAKYEVYSTDQIEARALLTPLFMERFVGLASGAGTAPPGAIVRGNRFLTAMPKRMPGDLFEPPSYWKGPGGHVLAALSRDIRAALDVADVIIDLDFWAAGKKQEQR